MEAEKIVSNLKDALISHNRETHDLIKECFLTDDPQTINKSIIKHPALYAFYAQHHAIAKIATLKAEYAMNDKYNSLAIAIRKKLGKGGEKYTETSIKQRIELQPEYKRQRDIHLQRLEEEKILGVVVNALDHKKDMIFSLASNYRQEMKQGILEASKILE